MKKLFSTMIITAMIFAAAATSAMAAAKTGDKPISKTTALLDDMQKQITKKHSLYIYLFAKSYETSTDEAEIIRSLAKEEDSGFVMADAEDEELMPVTGIYNITYVPTVVKLDEGAGVVEKFEGRKAVKRLAPGRKKPSLHEVTKEISKNSANGVATLLEFYADWCSPCLQMMPELERLEKGSGGKLDVIRVHVDNEPVLLKLYNVDSPPANILIDSSGVPVLRTSSAQSITAALYNIGILK